MIADAKAVANYAAFVMESRGMLANLTAFFDTLPAPDDDGNLPTLNYGQLGTLNKVHSLLIEASETLDEFDN